MIPSASKVQIYRGFPIAESIGIMLRISTDHRYEGEAEDDGYENDLSARKPELALTIPPYSEKIDDAGMC